MSFRVVDFLISGGCRGGVLVIVLLLEMLERDDGFFQGALEVTFVIARSSFDDCRR